MDFLEQHFFLGRLLLSSVDLEPPFFGVYRSQEVLSLFSNIYALEALNAPHELRPALPNFFQSSKIGLSSPAFFLPFNFLATSFPKSNSERSVFFNHLNEWSKHIGINMTLSSLDLYDEAPNVIVSNNPILKLPKDIPSLTSGFGKNLRNDLRRLENKAKALGIDCYVSNSDIDLTNFYYQILAPQYVRKHRMVFQPLSIFLGLMRIGVVRLVLARQGSVLKGGLVLIEDAGGVHYAWGASESPDNLAVGKLLLNFALHDAVGRHEKWFDFGGTAISDVDLLDFKLKWGGVNYKVRKYYTSLQPQAFDLNSSFSLARRIYSLLPSRAAAKIMPTVIPWLVCK